MDPKGPLYRFGPFLLDLERRRLDRGADRVYLPDRSMDVLQFLVGRAGQIVSQRDLTEAVWTDFNVTDNAICRVVCDLRKGLGQQEDGTPFIETLIRKGYRFVATVQQQSRGDHSFDMKALVEPYGAFADGRAAIETLDLGAVGRARDAFSAALRLAPDYAPAHVGMAWTSLLRYESTRADIAPDMTALAEAELHAHTACRINPSSGHVWSTLAFVQHRRGSTRDAIAAARKAIALQPEDWLHHLRLAYVGWGAERLQAAHHVLGLYPGSALAHWFAATVFVARDALDMALDHLRAGCASQDAQRKSGKPFAAVGLHLLHGLVLAARGTDLSAARDQFQRELALERPGLVYARECCANTWYAIGALALREERCGEARAAFQETLSRLPGHALAAVGLAFASGTELPVTSSPRFTVMQGDRPNSIQAATVAASVLALRGQHAEAARICGEALEGMETGSAGWMLPVDPLVHISAHRDAWSETLDLLRDRAT